MDYENQNMSFTSDDTIDIDCRFDEHTTNLPRVRGEFNEAMRRIAHWMAKEAAGGGSRINAPLKTALINLFLTVKYEALVTSTPIGNGRSENLVFLLRRASDDCEQLGQIEKPHKGRVIFVRDQDGNLCVPVKRALIPITITDKNIDGILKPAGEKIREAFDNGKAELSRKKPTHLPRIRHEMEDTNMAQREIQMLSFKGPTFLQRSKLGTFDGEQDSVRGKKARQRHRERQDTVRAAFAKLRT